MVFEHQFVYDDPMFNEQHKLMVRKVAHLTNDRVKGKDCEYIETRGRTSSKQIRYYRSKDVNGNLSVFTVRRIGEALAGKTFVEDTTINKEVDRIVREIQHTGGEVLYFFPDNPKQIFVLQRSQCLPSSVNPKTIDVRKRAKKITNKIRNPFEEIEEEIYYPVEIVSGKIEIERGQVYRPNEDKYTDDGKLKVILPSPYTDAFAS